MRENQSISALIRVLPPAFNPSVEGEEVRLTRDSSSWVLQPFWLGEGYPADARRILNLLDERYPGWRHPSGAGSGILPVPVLAARRMSSGARELLDAEQISWVDTAGRAQIAIPGELYISRLPPIPGDVGRPFRWSAAAAVVAEWVLSRAVSLSWDERVKLERVNVIAESTGLSTAHVARVLRQFDEQQYTIKTGAERGSSATREFRDLGRLLSDWAAHKVQWGLGHGQEFTVPWREPGRTITALESALGDLTWAVTGTAAADLIAPHLTSVPTVDVYINEPEDREVFELLSGLEDFTKVPKGGRVRLFAESTRLFAHATDHDGVRVISPIRVYADLLREGGRATEAAEYLRESIIGF